MQTVSLGTISHATLRTEDLIPAFADELRRLDVNGKYAALIAECDALEDFDEPPHFRFDFADTPVPFADNRA